MNVDTAGADGKGLANRESGGGSRPRASEPYAVALTAWRAMTTSCVSPQRRVGAATVDHDRIVAEADELREKMAVLIVKSESLSAEFERGRLEFEDGLGYVP